MMMQEGRDFISHEADDVLEPLSPENDEEQQQQQPTTKKRKSNKNNKRRFSDQQVRSLETIFESETKLEPRKKVQVARELGLQPRQVAIWFQNKRARWKSKEIEKNYRVLKSNYDCLKARLEAVRKDKESLLTQLQELRSVLERSRDSTEDMAKSSRVQQEDMERQGLLVYSDDDRSGNMEYLKQEEAELMNVDGSIVSPVKWCSFDAESLFDQSSTSSHWWESWT